VVVVVVAAVGWEGRGQRGWWVMVFYAGRCWAVLGGGAGGCRRRLVGGGSNWYVVAGGA
jgi:hypothetical protein